MYNQTLKHFYSIIDHKDIECDFKYKMIYSLDKVHSLDKTMFIYPLLLYFSECEKICLQRIEYYLVKIYYKTLKII